MNESGGKKVVIIGSVNPPIPATIDLQYSEDGSHWKTIASVEAAYGQYSYEWTPPPTKCFVRAVYSGEDGRTSSQPVLLELGRRTLAAMPEWAPYVVGGVVAAVAAAFIAVRWRRSR